MAPFCFNVLNPSMMEFQSSGRFVAKSFKLQRGSKTTNERYWQKLLARLTFSKSCSYFVHVVKIVNHEHVAATRGDILQLSLTRRTLKMSHAHSKHRRSVR
eukprot:m.314035 g.314035  ORF g.314035 m.314035 type:complete len:101 (+) comp473556_c0_seq1:35-337(+)